MSGSARKQQSGSQELSLAKAKATFSAVINSVEKKHQSVTILRRGKPVAQVVPFPETPRPKLGGALAGTVRVLGDIVNPYMEEWTVRSE